MLSKVISYSQSNEIESKLDALNKSQAIIEFNVDGVILDANDNFLKVMGYDLAEIQGKHHRMFVDADYARSVDYAAFWEALRRGEFQVAEYKRITKSGKDVWIQASYNPLINNRGKVFKIIKFATDITQQKMRNADYEGQLRAISKSQAVIQFNLDGTIIDANENFLMTLGYSIDEVRGKHHRIFVDPAYGNSVEYNLFWDCLRRGEYQAGEYRRLGKGSREIWIQASYNPILDINGHPFKVVKYASDTTKQVLKRIENERITSTITQNLETISGAVTKAYQQSTSAVSASNQTSSTVQAVASAAEELSASINEIAQSMVRSREAVDAAIAQTTNADNATQILSKNAESMTGIAELIQNIAGQINLLALNATIESARAGEAGKGFAVVANEVKSLASQVAAATSKISSEISELQSVSASVIKALELIKNSVQLVQTSVTTVAAAVDEQSAVTVDISSNMQQAAMSVNSVDASVQEITQVVNEAEKSAQQVKKDIAALKA